jgi:alpha-tubulin suppressor-like RCC1 family protein
MYISSIKGSIYIGSFGIIIKNGELYTSGFNEVKQLGLGDNINRRKFIKIPNTLIFTNSDFESISSDGQSYFIAKKNSGEIYGSGNSSLVTLIYGLNRVTKLLSDDNVLNGKVKQITSQNAHACIINNDNKVYVRGTALFGKLGNGETIGLLTEYTLINELPSISICGCTNANTILLSVSGDLYSTGEARLGVLGNGTTEPDISTFTKVPFNKPVKSLYANYNSVTVITTDDKLYGCGSNPFGHLGQGGNIIKEYTLIPNSSTFTNENIRMATHGMYHLLILKKNGTLYSCGRNDKGQLGLGNNTNHNKPILIDNGPIDYIGCGRNSSGFYKNGEIYTFGENNYGQLGQNHLDNVNTAMKIITLIPTKEITSTPTPTKAITSTPIPTPIPTPTPTYDQNFQLTYEAINRKIMITKSGYIIRDGVLYTCGLNGHYQLGLGNNINRKTYIKIPTTETFTNDNFISVITVTNSPFMVSTKNTGEVYGCGYTTNNIFGNNTNSLIQFTKLFTDNSSLNGKVKQITADKFHACIVTTTHDVYVIGNQQYGALGNGQITGVLTTYTKIEKVYNDTQLEDIQPIAMCGCTYNNTILLSKTGKLYSTGRALSGMLANGTRMLNGTVSPDGSSPLDISTFTLVPFVKSVKLLYTSDNAATVITSDNKLYGCGINLGNKLGPRGSYATRFALVADSPTFINENIKIATHGSHHLLILKYDGSLYGCGTGIGAAGAAGTLPKLLFIGSADYIGCGINSSAFSSNGKIYTFGANEEGQLGLGHLDDVNEPTYALIGTDTPITPIPLITQEPNTNIISQSYKLTSKFYISHSAFIIINGILHVSGKNSFNELGLGNNIARNTYIKIPDTLIFTNSNFITVTSGGTWTDLWIALKVNGEVYGCGGNYGYSLFGDNINNLFIVTELFQNNLLLKGNIRHITHGGQHTCLVTFTNKVYVVGSADYGKLGNGQTTGELTTYTEIDLSPLEISRCGCTSNNTLLLTTTGDLYSTGSSEEGGNPTYGMHSMTSTFNKVPFDKSVKLLYANYGSSIVITTENKLYGCGWNFYKHLGQGGNVLREYTLIPNSSTFTNENIRMAAHGQFHLLILDTNGVLYSCGRNDMGQLGFGNNIDIDLPKKLDYGPIDYISCGKNSSGYSKNGQLYTFGENTDGQLGLGHNNNVLTPTNTLINE